MDPEQFQVFRHEAVHELMRLNEQCEQTFRISSCPRWDYDLNAGTLTFSEDGTPKVIASIQVIGTASKSEGTWKWAWANESLPARVTEAVAGLRVLGEREDIAELTLVSLPDDDYIGWEMCAIAAKLLRSKGAYRCPGANGALYVVYSSIWFANEKIAPTEKSKQIECATHGGGFETFVCEHLVANPAQKWFSGERHDTDQWPDAWCASCDALFQEEGEWNEKNEAKLGIKLLCHFCYERLRVRELFQPSARVTTRYLV
jgi:hypothetical protein